MTSASLSLTGADEERLGKGVASFAVRKKCFLENATDASTKKRLNTVIVWMAHKPNRGNIVVLSNLFSLVFTPSLLTVA